MSVQPPPPRPDGKDAAAPQAGPQDTDCPVLTERKALEHLLSLAGAEAGRLMGQLSIDLAAVDANLRKALDEGDRAALRAATHVLIALAGTVGATGLCGLARDLNTAALGADWQRIRQDIPPLLDDLAHVRAAVAARAAQVRP